MADLTWTWLCAPYLVCAVTLIAVALTATLVRGDRVMRLGVAGSAFATLPWSICSALSACSQDPATSTTLLRLGMGPIALVGPNVLLVMLGVSGQLERHRWLARLAGLFGAAMLGVCWGTAWMVPGVQRLASGMLYTSAGPLTDLHISQLVLWLAVGGLIVRRAGTRGEQRGVRRMMFAVLALGAVGSLDVLLVHGIWGRYPFAWLPTTVAALIALYLVLRTDLLRPQGLDRGVLVELIGYAAAAVVIGLLALVLEGAEPLSLVALASLAWAIALGVTRAIDAQRPVRVTGQRALEQFVARLGDVDDERVIAERLTALWKGIAIEVRATWRTEGEQLVELATGATWSIDRAVTRWLCAHGQAVAPGDLATIRLGSLRPQLEALVGAHGASLIVPLIDREALVGLVEADHHNALREEERGLVVESARAAARAVTYAALARAAAKERETAREVEVAEAMRRQATASRDDELGRWTVAIEYKPAPRTTGAAWSAALLADGQLAVLVTESQAQGVAAALATAALIGAFTAATSGQAPIELDDLLTSLRASAFGVMRGGEPIAAFIAVCDADRQRIVWACAGHPGAYVVGPVAHEVAQFPAGSSPALGPTPLGGGGVALGASHGPATRGEARLPPDSLLVIVSSAVRGEDKVRWQAALREHALAGPRLATVLVEAAVRRGDRHEDFLAVVVRQRSDRRSVPILG